MSPLDVRSNPSPPAQTRQTVLVVDDEPTIRTLWRRYLTRWGYDTDLAENGREALDKIRRNSYDLLITDLTMPEMTGNELVHVLREEQPDLDIIVTTGFGTVEVAVDMMKAGVREFITKPISFKHAEQVILKCAQRVAARRETEYLRQQNRDLEELNRVKEKFIAITSHELRTPVSLINNVAEILVQELRGHAAETLLRMIVRASRQLTEIVTQMYQLSLASAGRLELQIDDFNLREVCGEVLREFELVIRERGHTVTLEVPAELSVRGDRVKLKKVVRELLQNAIKFTNDGGHIVIAADGALPGRVSFSVKDDGIGISAAEQDKVFDMFYEIAESRHHSSSESAFKGGGMGIGLAMVSDIVKAHHGTITLHSRPNEGATFVVTLPQ
ncbi:MAG: hybrid sensor histidine kinase/response regulator [Candidatus Lambdaproteobacteria bacterium]|nr:hybrid sensor histidine kinase/response regulator [Candidatus Lambdaproteobacteria bacterium]